MPLQASTLPIPLLPSSAGPTSLLLDPTSSSLAVLLSDSSVLLFSNPKLPGVVPTVISPVSISAAFLTLNPNPGPNSTQTLFLTISPSFQLRAWALRGDRFSPVPISPPSLPLRRGFGVRIAGSVNYLAVHSASSAQIWVLGARAVSDGIYLVKCAVVECVSPIYELRVGKGLMALGEAGGIRVFPLRPLVKGGDVRKRKSTKKKELTMVAEEGIVADGGRAHGKLRTLKLRQNSGEFGSFFMMIKCDKIQNPDSNIGVLSSVKAVSIHILSPKKLLVLDSGGDLYLLSRESSGMTSQATSAHSSVASKFDCLNRLDVTMKVQMLAVLPDISESRQVLWLSDGLHSVHVLSVDDMESPDRENDNDENKEKSLQISAIHAIFTSEKVQDIVPLSASAILLLGQRKIFAYSIS